MQHQPIFSYKYLKTKLSNFSLTDIPEIQSKQQKIVEWQTAIKKGSIKKTKEEALQSDFLNAFFGEVLGYDYNRADDKWYLEKEFKSVMDGSKADGALGYFSIVGQDARAVIELKDAKTDLDKPQNRIDKRTPVEQAFGYANKAGGKCRWVIVSNFLEIRLYHSSDQSKYELFDILELLNEENLKKFFFLLQKGRLILEHQKSFIDIFYEERQAEEEIISKRFYKDYKNVRIELFDHLKKNNPKHSEVLLFTKAQKILDRVIFICFCEDLTLIPKYTFRNIIAKSETIIDFSDNKLWTKVKNLFKAIDKGYPDASINKFNGGLFAEDKDLDNLIINDSVIEHIVALSKYDFESDLNVNILGHIFEQSISDIEEIKAQISGEDFDEAKGKRKKDGIFYTPEYITRYIVKEAVGGWLEDRKIELGVDNLPVLSENDINSIQLKTVVDKAQKKKVSKLDYNKNVEKHILFWEAFREKLSNIKVLDPACGSGAFLNQVFDYLHREGEAVNNELAKLKLGQREAFDLDKHILNNNIFGVDLNPESVEITKLSLWLKTANRHKELTALDDNIQCGNSLIDNAKMAGESAFNWKDRFKKVFKNGGFDVVLGNPPYGILIDKKLESYYREHFPLTSYKINLYILFMERMFQLFDQTVVHFIIPKSLLFNSFYSDFRKYLIEKSELNEIFTLTEKVFEDAEVGGSLIIRLTIKQNPNPKNIVQLISSTTYTDFLSNNKIENALPQNFFLTVPNNEISIVSSDTKNVIKKLHKLKGISEYYGLKNGLNPGNIKHILISDKKSSKNHKPIIWGKDISKYGIEWSNEYVNYDKSIGDEISLDDLKSKKGMNKQEKIDFALRTPEMFEVKKIVVRKTGDSLIASLDSDNFYFDTLVHGIYKKKKDFSEEYLLTILNSKPATLFYRLLHDIKGKVFAKISLDNLSEFPIPNAKDSEKSALSEKAKIMLEKTKEKQKVKTEFLQFFCEKFNIDKPTTKLQNWDELEFKNFLKELRTCKVILNTQGEFDFMGLFNKQKKVVGEIQTILTDTNYEIDKFVYRLYDISKEEIEMIEGQ
jgi:hypothetical protein